MNYEQLKGLVFENFAEQMPSDRIISNAMFRAIRDMQEDTRCSIKNFEKTVAVSTEELPLASFTYDLSSADYGYEAGITATVNLIYVHTIYDITETDPVVVYDADKEYMDDGVYEDAGKYGAVTFDSSSLKLFTNFDLNGITLRIRANFVVDYVEGEFAKGTKVNLLINTIPVNLHRYLEDGIKAYVFKSLFEDTARKDYMDKYNFYNNQWRVTTLPFVKQLVGETQPKNLTYKLRSPKMISVDRTGIV